MRQNHSQLTACDASPVAVAVYPRTFYARFLKRVLDFIVVLAILPIVIPLMLLVGLAVLIFLGPPVLFRDVRAGLGGKPIKITKFRSMMTPTEVDGKRLSDAERLGYFGSVLRRSSLDELPQLYSVMCGDLSLVGPRPLPMRYVSRYTPTQATRLLVRPGITGFAQIRGRNAIDWQTRFEYDAQYVQALGRWYGPFLDIAIIGLSILLVPFQAITGQGINARGTATAEEFVP